MTTFLGVWHQSLALTSKWLPGRRGVRGGDSRLHCAVLPAVSRSPGAGKWLRSQASPKRRKNAPEAAQSAEVLGGESLHRPQLRRIAPLECAPPRLASQGDTASISRPSRPIAKTTTGAPFAPRTAACRGGKGGRQDDVSLRGDGAGDHNSITGAGLFHRPAP